MRAHRAQADVPRWYFIARNRTIGSDLSLMRGRDPIGKSELAAALGDDGEVLDSQRDYRTRLNDLLFGFGGEEQYQTMLRLMRDLRRPHLSKTLDPDRVADQLTVGLPGGRRDADAAARRRARAARDARARPRPAARRARATCVASISAPTAPTPALSFASAPTRFARRRPRSTNAAERLRATRGGARGRARARRTRDRRAVTRQKPASSA